MTMHPPLPGLPTGISKVDCGTCRRCCKGQQLILLTEADDHLAYDCREVGPDLWAVNRQANGDCIYLGEDGCTIYGRHPQVCKVFNCVDFVRMMDAGAFDGHGPRITGGVVKEGRKRMARQERGQG